MAARGVDYTAGRLTAAQLRAADMEFAGRYIGRTTRLPAKFATADEVADFDAHGIGLVLFFEDGPRRALGGAPAGRADAEFAARQCAALGASDHPVLYAVDFPATLEQIGGPIAQYFAAAADVRGLPAAGCYGSYDTVRILLDRHLATYACQTPAWSGGRRDPRAQLYQGDPETNAPKQTTVAGVLCDVLVALVDDYGQGDDMALSAEDRDWLLRVIPRGTLLAITGQPNSVYGAEDAAAFGPTAMSGQIAMLPAAVTTAVTAAVARLGITGVDSGVLAAAVVDELAARLSDGTP